jgi:hypothetical protein
VARLIDAHGNWQMKLSEVLVKIQPAPSSQNHKERPMFHDLLNRLEEHGWREECPTRNVWTFTKKNWVCKVYWSYGTVAFWRSFH